MPNLLTWPSVAHHGMSIKPVNQQDSIASQCKKQCIVIMNKLVKTILLFWRFYIYDTHTNGHKSYPPRKQMPARASRSSHYNNSHSSRNSGHSSSSCSSVGAVVLMVVMIAAAAEVSSCSSNRR